MKNKISNLILERYLLNELSPQDRLNLEQALEVDPTLNERLNTLKSQSLQITEKLNPQQMVHRIRTKVLIEKNNQLLSKEFSPLLKLAGVFSLLCLFVLPIYLIHFSDEQTLDGIRVKGNAYLSIFRKTSAEPERLESHSLVKAGDQIQIRLHPQGEKYATVFSIDGRGETTLHFPDSPISETTILRAGPQLLPFAYELDDAPGFEQFFLISSQQSFSADHAMELVKNQCPAKLECTKISLPENYNWYTLTLKKETK
jgi:hypothetical protein